jgi:hypothetical protein
MKIGWVVRAVRRAEKETRKESRALYFINASCDPTDVMATRLGTVGFLMNVFSSTKLGFEFSMSLTVSDLLG